MSSRFQFFALLIFLCSPVQVGAATSDETIEVHQASESALSVRQLEILRTALSVNGVLTKEMHSEFWRGFGQTDESRLKEIQKQIEGLAPAALLYQRALWQSAESSLRKSSVTRSRELMVALDALKASNPKALAAATEQAQALLEAAANGTPLQKEGQPFYVTEELVEHTLAGLEGSVSRLEQLSKATWAGGDGT